MDDDELGAFFDAGRGAAPAPSAALMARIMADAEAVQGAGAPVVSPRRGRGALGRALAALGGWIAVAGLATSAFAGVGVGYYGTDVLSALATGGAVEAASDAGYDLSDLAPSFYDLAEGS